MPREIAIPAQTIREEIRALEEYSPTPKEPGYVRVQVGRVDASGAFIVPQSFDVYEIRGNSYEALTGPAGPWAPDKPAGTYRTDDLWFFIDRARAAMKRAAELKREQDEF